MTILDFATTLSGTTLSGTNFGGTNFGGTDFSGTTADSDAIAQGAFDRATPRLGVASIQLHDDLWRVTRTDGEVLGYIEQVSSAAGSRFVAKRMLQRQRRFLPVGEFWTVDDAMDCFRF